MEWMLYYEARGLKLNDRFMKNLELLTPEGQANYAAYLLADENGVSVQVAKYADRTRVDLVENRDFGRCSLVKALKGVLERMDVENTIYTKIGFPLREEQEMIDSVAMREAVINAIVHNDYSNGACPKFEFFTDRLEITSAGGLPYGVTEEDFFSGYSSPRNKEIMRVFRDLEIVEQLGSGVPRILERYGRDVFEIRPNFVRVVLPHEDVSKKRSPMGSPKSSPESSPMGAGKTAERILELVKENPLISTEAMGVQLGISKRAVIKQTNKLQDSKKLRRVGGTRGHWEVTGE